jgi:Flp pilus assembly protein TadG
MTPPVEERRNQRRGSALIEFALTFVVLFPLMTGIFQFGYCLFNFMELKNAVREGARYASLRTYDSNSSTYSSAFGAAVRNVVVYGDPNGGRVPSAPRLTTANVSLTVTFSSGVPRSVTVSIVNYSLPAAFTTFILNKPSSTFPYTGRYAPAGA